MNIVERIARLIDQEGAYGEWYGGTRDTKKLPFTTRQKYFQALYELKAIEVIKAVLALGPEKSKEDLIAFEKAGWKKLGIPIDSPMFAGIVEDKY